MYGAYRYEGALFGWSHRSFSDLGKAKRWVGNCAGYVIHQGQKVWSR